MLGDTLTALAIYAGAMAALAGTAYFLGWDRRG